MSRAPTWLIVLLYAVSSVLWVGAASYIISITLDDPVLRSRAYLANQLILVAISTALFYILLKIGKNTPSAPVIHPLRPARPGKQLLMLVPLAMVAPLMSIGIVNTYRQEIERNTYADLQTISDLKAEQIELWLDERHGDAETLMASHELIEQVRDPQHEKDVDILRLAVNRLEAVRKAYRERTCSRSPKRSVTNTAWRLHGSSLATAGSFSRNPRSARPCSQRRPNASS